MAARALAEPLLVEFVVHITVAVPKSSFRVTNCAFAMSPNTAALQREKLPKALHRVAFVHSEKGLRGDRLLGVARLRGGWGQASEEAEGNASSVPVPSKRRTSQLLLGLHVLEFGVPPLLFLYLALCTISNPASSPALVTFLTAAAAAVVAEVVTFPADALKARMQLRSQSASPASSTPKLPPFQAFLLLFYGLRTALCRTIPYTGSRSVCLSVYLSCCLSARLYV